MLNTKYFIISDEKGAKSLQVNPEPNGNAWFVENVQFVQSANTESNWNFSLKEFEELQYTLYNVGDHYDWHHDCHNKPYENKTIRKLSFTLCLNDEYEGGDFSICETHPISEKTKVKSFALKKGEMIVFPSHTWHKVNKVTKGIRKALVGWVVGKPFI
mgnify:CR=1 FL=1